MSIKLKNSLLILEYFKERKISLALSTINVKALYHYYMITILDHLLMLASMIIYLLHSQLKHL
jgi:hypothetical protein